MRRAELRRAMRQKKAELKVALRRARREQRARLEQNPLFRKQRARRRWRNGVLAALVLVLAALSRCECAEPPPPPIAVEVPAPPPPPAPPPVPEKPAPRAKKPLDADMEAQRRGGYAGEGRRNVTWVDEFRLQVAARSQRLAACFTGVERPGALRWTSSVNAESGVASDHELEALASSAPVGPKERQCLVEALSSPPYKLAGAPAGREGLPNRVSIVIEF